MAEPARFSYVLLLEILQRTHGGKYDPRPAELDRVIAVFNRCGGDWSKILLGDIANVKLLKRVLRIACQSGHLTEKVVWT